MRIGLYFGSFNPIHIGHLIIGNHIASLETIDQVWFVVSPQNPLKESKTLLNEYHRLHLARISIQDNPTLKVSDVEFKLSKPSYTIDTLTYLKEKYPSNTFSIIIGSDSLQNIKKWKNHKELLTQHSVYVYNRPNYPIDNTVIGNILPVTAPLLEISSTYIRDLIKKGKSIQYLVTDAAREEIERNNYYK